MFLCRRAGLMALLALIAFTVAGRAPAQTPAMDFLNYTSNWEYTQSSYVIGGYFQVNSAIAVTALGWYNDANGLSSAHPVGIYDIAAGQYVATTTVQPGDPLVNLFRYHDLNAPVILQAGKQYALVGVSFKDLYLSFIPNQSYILTDPRVTYVGGAIDYTGNATQLGPPVQYYKGASYWPVVNMKISDPPAYSITGLSPSSVRVNSASFQMTITGSGFNVGSVVKFNNTQLALFSATPTQIVITVPGNLLNTVGTYNVTVTTGGVRSNSLPFTITATQQGPPRLALVGVPRTGTDTFSGVKYAVLLVRNSGGADATNINFNDVRLYYDVNDRTKYVTPTAMTLESGATPPGNLSRTAPGEILQIRWDWPTTANGPVRTGVISVRGVTDQGAFNAGSKGLVFP